MNESVLVGVTCLCVTAVRCIRLLHTTDKEGYLIFHVSRRIFPAVKYKRLVGVGIVWTEGTSIPYPRTRRGGGSGSSEGSRAYRDVPQNRIERVQRRCST